MPRERSIRWWRVVLGVWLVALAVLCVRPLFQPYRNTVYPIFAGAGRHWFSANNLYEPMSLSDSFRYSPLVAALFVPFGLLPDGLGGMLWRMLCVTVFLVGWGRFRVLSNQFSVLVLLMAPSILGNLHNGQANLLIIGLLLLSVAAVARNQFYLAAFGLSIACLFKIYPIAIGLLLALLYPRRLAPRLVLFLALGLLLPFLLQRPNYVADQYAGWTHHLTENDRGALSPNMSYRDARLLWRVWIAPMSYTAYQGIQLAGAAVGAGAILAARRTGLAPARLLVLVLGLGCCWMTALGPATESATYVLLAPTLAWLLVSPDEENHPIGLRVLGWMAYGLLMTSQLVVALPGGWGREFLSLGPQPLAGLLVLAGLLYLTHAEIATANKARTIVRAGSSTLMEGAPAVRRSTFPPLVRQLAGKRSP